MILRFVLYDHYVVAYSINWFGAISLLTPSGLIGFIYYVLFPVFLCEISM